MKPTRLIPVAMALLLVGCGGAQPAADATADENAAVDCVAALTAAQQAEALHFTETQTTTTEGSDPLTAASEVWQVGEDLYRVDTVMENESQWLVLDGKAWCQDAAGLSERDPAQIGTLNWQQPFSLDSYSQVELTQDGDTVTLRAGTDPMEENGTTAEIETVLTFADGDALTFQRFESTTTLTAEGQSQTFTVTAELLGIMSARDAMKLAREAELDLVKIAPTAKPPVCKIIDYGKYRYELARKEKEARKKQKIIEIKEVRLSPNIDVNDLNTKINNARKFITKGNKVKVTLRFRGREMAHMQASRHILDDFAKQLEDIAVIDKPIKQEGRSLTLFLGEKR